MRTRTLRINNLDFHGSTCDGPGVRNVVFLQGCLRHCPGCHNMGTWNTSGGYEIALSDLVSIIDQETPMRRITISGGEPLLQPEGLLELAHCLREKGYDIAVYTGNSLADVPNALLDTIDYIKVGDYQREAHSSITPYVGSTNQEFIKLR